MQYEFDIVRKGYDKEQVAEYISTLHATIEEYKFKEEQTKNLVKLAEDKAKKIVEDAREEAIRVAKEESDRLIDGAYSKLYSIQETMQDQRILLNDFRKDYNRFILKYVNEVNKRNFVQLQTSVDDIENYINETMKAAENTKNGYFVPNPTKTDGPIIIVEPSVSDISSTKLQEHFIVEEDVNADTNTTHENVFFENPQLTTITPDTNLADNQDSPISAEEVLTSQSDEADAITQSETAQSDVYTNTDTDTDTDTNINTSVDTGVNRDLDLDLDLNSNSDTKKIDTAEINAKLSQQEIELNNSVLEKNEIADLENTEVHSSNNVVKEFDELFDLAKEETLIKHLEEQETTDQVQEIQDTLLNMKPVE